MCHKELPCTNSWLLGCLLECLWLDMESKKSDLSFSLEINWKITYFFKRMFHVSKKTKCLRDSVFCLVSSYCMISAQSKSSLDGSLQVNRLFQVIRFTQVYRITTHGPVAHGGPDKSGANCTLLCKDTVKAWQRACNSKYTQLKKAQLEGACSSDANCLLLKDGGGTGGLRHPPPASRWKHPPRPFLFFHLSYFSQWMLSY